MFKILILSTIFFYLSLNILSAQELRGIKPKKSHDLLIKTKKAIRIASGFDDGVLDGSKRSKIIKRTYEVSTTTTELILGANPLGIIAGNLGMYGLRRKIKKETGCSNIYKNCCFNHRGVKEIKEGLTYCVDGDIKIDCNCNN